MITSWYKVSIFFENSTFSSFFSTLITNIKTQHKGMSHTFATFSDWRYPRMLCSLNPSELKGRPFHYEGVVIDDVFPSKCEGYLTFGGEGEQEGWKKSLQGQIKWKLREEKARQILTISYLLSLYNFIICKLLNGTCKKRPLNIRVNK